MRPLAHNLGANVMDDIIKRWMELEGPATVLLVTDTIQEMEKLRAGIEEIAAYPTEKYGKAAYRAAHPIAAKLKDMAEALLSDKGKNEESGN